MRFEPSRVSFLCALALASASCGRTPEPSPAPAASTAARAEPVRDLIHDERLAHLVGGCANTSPFLEDTSDVVPALVSKLAAGHVDPQRVAREDLAAIGAAALPALERLYTESYGEPFLAQRVQNVVEVLAWMPPTERAHELVLRALRHPQESVRKAAARALVRVGTPADYDLAAQVVPMSSPDLQADLFLALLACDRPRLEREYVAALETGDRPFLVRHLTTHVCTTRDPEVVARLKGVIGRLEERERLFLSGTLAANGDTAALEELRRELATPGNPARRQTVAQVFVTVGLGRELATRLTDADPDDAQRKLAVDALARVPPDDATRDALRRALADPLADVSKVALAALVQRGDGAAIDAALQHLLGARDEFDAGLQALLPVARTDATLARRVFDTLRAVHQGDVGSGRVDERSLVRAVGQLPLAEAATWVLDQWKPGAPDIQGLPAHRWYAQAASNTVPAGVPVLRARWEAETDPARRMDYVTAISAYKNDDVRAFLLVALDDPRATPPEVLYVADRCARFGPGPTMAPALKRAALRVGDPIVRPALNCLLWDFYGISK